MLGQRWGVDDAEVARPYPCDVELHDATMAAWRGVTVQAPAARVWPWLVQIRLAPYSYDRIDNLGRRSPRTLCGLPDPMPDDPFTAVGGRPVGRVLSVSPGEQLTGRIMGAVMSYVLVPGPRGTTRLLLKVVARGRRPAMVALCLGDLVMARRQLLNLKQLAESCA